MDLDNLTQAAQASTHLIVWTLITFGLTVLILGKWGWPAILAALEAREKGIQDDLDAAKRGREEAEKLLSEHKKLMAEADDKIRALVDEAKRDADVVKAEIEKKAQEEAKLTRDRALRDIELAKDAAIGSLREECVNLSVAMASKILNREIKSGDHQNLVDDCLKEIGA